MSHNITEEINEFPSDAGSREDIVPADIALAVLRYRWLFLGVVVLTAAFAVIPTYFSPPTWTATASFMPEAADNRGGSRLSTLAGQFGVDLGAAGSVGQSHEFYADLVESREILAAVAADTFHLGRQGTLAELLGIELETPAAKRAAVIDWLSEVVSTSSNAPTRVVKVQATAPSAELSAQVVARILEAVNQFNLRTRQNQAMEERRFMEARLDYAQNELREAEEVLQRFLQSNREFRNSPELFFEYQRLERQMNMRQQLVTSLMQSYEQARINEVRNTPAITIIEEAEVPVRPDRRRRKFRLIVGLLAGTVVGTMFALGLEFFRRYRAHRTASFDEVIRLWRETKRDLGRLTRWIRR